MRPASRHPDVQRYFADLRAAAAELPEAQRTALLADAVTQLDRSLERAHSDADVATVLASFADPEHVVAATASIAQLEATEPLPSGALGLYLGIVGMVFVFFPWVGVGIGVLAVVVSAATLVRRRRSGATAGVSIGGLAAGIVAIVLPLVLMAVIDNFEKNEADRPVNTLVTGQ